MIKYRLICDADHEFEGWFRDSADFDVQAEKGLLDCPSCGSGAVRKAVMAPAIGRKGAASQGDRKERLAAIQQDMARAVARARDYVEKNFDYVGEKFPEEARKIHYGEAEERGIYGEASGKEVKELVEEGVEVSPMPGAPAKTDAAGEPKTPEPQKKLN
ncbi:DUF1178 family protein [Hyphococcus luteus]|uniref:DUF1178 domain-containing protein n=1 Tax=Hyphococcus luteus TaxID=2058213 RepID=A0A2S7K1Y1_9PROT|nr:DUF1178 family protein [Marinicaulis flavus]PQA86496.1 DUF1178 domain-containing protein [Marinicaulis flavus]